jgi:hypothetical protein
VILGKIKLRDVLAAIADAAREDVSDLIVLLAILVVTFGLLWLLGPAGGGS